MTPTGPSRGGRPWRSRLPVPRHSTVVAYLALFIALGGSAAALSEINGKEIINRTISGSKLMKHTLSGTQINLSSLGTVPSATYATSAGTATTAAHADTASSATTATSATTAGNAVTLDGLSSSAFLATGGTAANSNQLGGVAAQPAFQSLPLDNCSAEGSGYVAPGYMVDAFGFVHLEGSISCSGSLAFTLPTAARPAGTVGFPLHDISSDNTDTQLIVYSSGLAYLLTSENSWPPVSLDGITFRAG